MSRKFASFYLVYFCGHVRESRKVSLVLFCVLIKCSCTVYVLVEGLVLLDGLVFVKCTYLLWMLETGATVISRCWSCCANFGNRV